MASIEISLNGQTQQTRSFEGDRLLIGREPTCNLQLNHPSVSRQHCAILRKSDVFVLEDLRSSNGTFVNGRKAIGTFYLNNGDEIQVGEYTLKFLFESAPSQFAPEFEPTMLVQNKEAQEALRKGILPPEAAPPTPTAPPSAIPAALPVPPDAAALSSGGPAPASAPPAPPVAAAPAPSAPPPAIVSPAPAPAPRPPSSVTPAVPPAPALAPAPPPLPKPPAIKAKGQDLAGDFNDPFDVPTLRPPPIEPERPKLPAMLFPKLVSKAPSVAVLPPPLPAAKPPSSVAVPVVPPPLPVSPPALVAPPPLPHRVAPAPPPVLSPAPPAAPPPLSPNDPRAAMTMLPPAPPVPPPPPMMPPLSPNDPRVALTMLPPTSSIPPPQPMAPAPAYQTPHGMTRACGAPTGPMVYAGFWIRFAAMLIDGIILGLPFSLVIAPLIFLVTQDPSIVKVLLLVSLSLVMMAGSFLYFVKMESGPGMGTFGKRIMGIQVTDLTGQRISFSTAVVRFLVRILLSGIMLIGYIMAAFTEKRQALHDMIAGTLVLKQPS